MSKNLIFIHGLEGSPQGIKAQEIRKLYPDAIIPQFTSDVMERLQSLALMIKEPAYLVGSSLGGLTAILFAMEFSSLVRAMVLLAPAVGLHDYSGVEDLKKHIMRTTKVTANVPTRIIATRDDEIIPFQDIEAMMERSGGHPDLKLIEVKDKHNLNQHLSLMVEQIEWMLNRAS